MVHFETVQQYARFYGSHALHPLAALVDLSKTSLQPENLFHFGIYAIFLKERKNCELKYGKSHYDFDEGTMVFFAPGQTVQVTLTGAPHQPSGLALVFHPDLIKGTALGKRIHEYSFFSYQSNEALHLSDKERTVITDCMENIETELNQNMDRHSKRLIVSNLELLLNYCTRFYDRQFITREVVHEGIVERFEALLNEYVYGEKARHDGLPSVAYFAGELHLSANYFGDLIKKETGKSALELIHLKLLEAAKERIFDTEKSLSEIAYELGFKYPQHFTRFFKQHVGYSPKDYRMLN